MNKYFHRSFWQTKSYQKVTYCVNSPFLVSHELHMNKKKKKKTICFTPSTTQYRVESLYTLIQLDTFFILKMNRNKVKLNFQWQKFIHVLKKKPVEPYLISVCSRNG